MDVAVLGDLRISHQGREVRIGGVKARALLSLLLVRRGEVVPADTLADELWQGEPPASAAGSLQVYVSRIRSVLRAEDVQIQTSKPGYVLLVRPGVLDVNRFEALVHRGLSLEQSGEYGSCAGTLRKALALWRGPAFGEFSEAAFARTEVARLEELRLQAFQVRGGADLRIGHWSSVITDVEAELDRYPLREPLWALLVRALVDADRRAEALQVYRSARAQLRDELGLEPGRELRAAQTLALQAPSPPGPAAAPGAPYRRRLPPQVARRKGRASSVGREQALAQLHQVWSSSSPPRVVLLTGEAGIGKTRLAEEFALRVDTEGAVVLWGSTMRDAPVPYEAVIAALREYVERLPEEERPVPEGVGGELLARLIPELATAVVLDAPEPVLFRRYLFFEAVADALLSSTGPSRTLMVLDDVEWADESTVALLAHLARHPRAERLLVLALHREEDTGKAGAAERSLRELEDEGLLQQLPLAGLTPRDSWTLLERVVGAPVTEEVAHALHEGTGGNPFFLLHAAHQLPADPHGSDPPRAARRIPLHVPLPELLRDLMRRRMAGFDEVTQDVLSAAAVIGQRFDSDVVAVVVDRSVDEVRSGLEQALNAGVLRRTEPSPTTWEFRHALVREALYRAAPPELRDSLHRRVGAYLEQGPVATLPLEQLVHHLRSSAAADAERAVRYACLAGDRAIDMLAFTEAIRHYETALQMLGLVLDRQDLRRCRLLLVLGNARLAEYEPDALRDTFRSAAALAQERRAPAELRRAVMGLINGTEFGTVDTEAAQLFRDSLDEPGPGQDPALLAILNAALARVLPADDPQVPRLTDAATTLVGDVDDAAARSFVLLTVLLINWGALEPVTRRSIAGEVITAAETCGAAEIAVEARNLRAAAGEELGDVGAVAADLTVLDRFARQSGRLFFRALSSMRTAGAALARGEYDESLAASVDLRRAARRSPNFFAAQVAQDFVLHRDRGTLPEVQDQVTAIATATASSAWRVVDALVHLELGDPQESLHRLQPVLAGGLDAVTRDWLWLPTMGYLAELCAALGLTSTSRELLGRLSPYAEHTVVVAHGVLNTGVAARNVALLQATSGDVDGALTTFRHAAEVNRTRELWPWLVRTDLAHAELLDRVPGGSPRAERLRGAALSTAVDIGMSGVSRTGGGARWLARSIDLIEPPHLAPAHHHPGSPTVGRENPPRR